MKKIKINFPQEDFGTLNTKYPTDSVNVASDDFTSGTKNLETSVKGIITKRKGGQVYSTLPTPAKDQFEAIFSDGTRHKLTVDNGVLRYSSGDGIETSVLSGLSTILNFEFATIQDRVYFGNGITTKVYDKVTNYGGAVYIFPTQTTKNMGAIAPTVAPIAALVLDSTVNQIPAGGHRYKVTFVYYDSEESNGGLVSNTVTNDATHTSNSLTNIPIGGYGVTQRKIYRDDVNDSFVLVGVINNNTATTFTDTVSAGLTPLPDDQGLPPDFTLITSYLDRLFLAGIPGDPYTIFFSDVGMPDIYPAFNTLTCNQEDPITGIAVYQDRLVVFNRRSMGQVLGKTSDQFRYAPIQSSVGCVDTRSIQIRVIDGVPILVWLSDKGFYAYNGNSVVYISDVIEDQINANIQQALVQRNRISHSDYTTFTSGTISDGINLEASPGAITTKGPYWDTIVHPGATFEEQTNPKKSFNSNQNWVAGTLKQNLVLDNSGTVQVPLRFVPDMTQGTKTGSIITNSTVAQLPTSGLIDYQEQVLIAGIGTYNGRPTYPSFPWVGGESSQAPRSARGIGIKFQIGTPGIIDSITAYFPRSHSSTIDRSIPFTVEIRPDLGGSPDMSTVVWYINVNKTIKANTSSNLSFPDIYDIYSTYINVNPGFYWLIVKSTYNLSEMFYPATSVQGTVPIAVKSLDVNGGWYTMETSQLIDTLFYGMAGQWDANRSTLPAPFGQAVVRAFPYRIHFLQGSIPLLGQWISTIYDANTINMSSGLTLSYTASFPSGTYGNGPYSTTESITLEATDDINFFTGIVSQTFSNINGPQSISLYNKRYWRLIVALTTTDRRASPAVSNLILTYNTQGIWESEVIDCTSDVDSYQSLITTKNEPAGTSVVTEIATSAVNIGPWTYVPFGSHTVRQYVKIRLTLNSNIDNSITPSVSSLGFSWVVGNGTSSSSFVSPPIDTGTTPSGWDIFQSSSTTNGGSITFYMRSAPTNSFVAPYDIWYPVTNGEFPPTALVSLQWVQWKAIIQANPDEIPTIDSVTIGWFVGTASQGIRCASIFYNKNYYVALSEFGSNYNNLVYVLDFTGKWRLFKDLNVSTMSYFFNEPYYGDAVTSKVVKFLEGNSDQGNPIELEVRTKAFDGTTQWTDNEDKIKVLDSVIVSVSNTGATYDCHYSIDEGQTFNPLYDTSGNNSWTVGTDNRETKKYLRPQYTVNIPQGHTLMFKIHNNDTKEVQIKSLKAEAFVREQPPIITG